MQELLIATTNPGKIAEIRSLLAGLPYSVIGLSDLDANIPSPEETGTTFAENALLKAVYYREHSAGLLTLADDSGLVVDALRGAPGIHSARYAGKNASSAEMISKLLSEMQGVPIESRTARFVCAIALAGDGMQTVFEGSCNGLIAFEPRGVGGFGYDPVFIDVELGLTFAEIPPESKAQRSHRGKALREVREFLQQLPV
ncbi:MAG: RdgB/HAM1 family non-canonical purine NTP pyrophosphatase [Acidobacteria bacterium]|nr:RdgB/HAM1 family non-canonical purine NTP pyrophosphatase [Acidobacteriota bacterium]MCW5967308.1 RdgB/HAM1 family non-canonical purine NTP pyrophosphatase [Blastocatellales bacterium]